MRDFTVVVTGGRDYEDSRRVRVALTKLWTEHGRKLVVVEGGDRGVDRYAAGWAMEYGSRHGVTLHTLRIDYARDGSAAARILNQRMLDLHHPDLVLCFPGGQTTADMVHRAGTLQIPVQLEGFEDANAAGHLFLTLAQERVCAVECEGT